MSNEVSVIVPTLNASRRIAGLLADLREGQQRGLVGEIIISDGGSSDMTKRLAEQAGATFILGRPGRGGQLARGARQAKGDWLLFLHADSRLPERWSSLIEQRLLDPQIAFCFGLSFDHNSLPSKIVSLWANLRTRMGLPYGDQGLLISRANYDQIGGFDDIPLMEDVDLVSRLPRAPVRLKAKIMTSAERYRREGWVRRGARNLFLLVRFWFGADPVRLSEQYYAKDSN